MSFVDQTWGTWLNVATVVAGAGIGLAVSGKLPPRVTETVMQGIGLVTLYVGIANALDLAKVNDPPGVIVGLMALAIGGSLGEWWRIEAGLDRLGTLLKARLKGRGRFTEGFVAASLLFCVGPLTLIGSIQNGLSGEAGFLVLKSALDGFSALALAASFGFGVLASALVVLVYQGGLSLAAGAFSGLIPDPAGDPRVLLVNGVGGLMIVALGLGLLDVKRVRVAAMLPALPLAVLFYWVAGLILGR